MPGPGFLLSRIVTAGFDVAVLHTVEINNVSFHTHTLPFFSEMSSSLCDSNEPRANVNRHSANEQAQVPDEGEDEGE